MTTSTRSLLLARAAATACLLLPWFYAPSVVAWVVERNAKNGLYGMRDAIIFPIGAAALMGMLLAPFLAIVLAVVLWRLNPDHFHKEFGWSWRVPVAIVCIVPLILVISALGLDWLSWDHAPIFLIYLVPVFWLSWAITIVSRRPRLDELVEPRSVDRTPSDARVQG